MSRRRIKAERDTPKEERKPSLPADATVSPEAAAPAATAAAASGVVGTLSDGEMSMSEGSNPDEAPTSPDHLKHHKPAPPRHPSSGRAGRPASSEPHGLAYSNVYVPLAVGMNISQRGKRSSSSSAASAAL